MTIEKLVMFCFVVGYMSFIGVLLNGLIKKHKRMEIRIEKTTFTIIPTIMIVPKKYTKRGRTYICFAWLFLWVDLLN